jgi:hypothetical protein
MLKISKTMQFVLIVFAVSIFITLCFGIYRLSLGCPGIFRDCYLEGANAFWEVDYLFRFLSLLWLTYIFAVWFVQILAKILRLLVNLISKN